MGSRMLGLGGEDVMVSKVSVTYEDDLGNEVKYGARVTSVEQALTLLTGHVEQVREATT